MRDQLRRTITRKFEIGTHASCSRSCILRIVTIVIRQHCSRRCLCLFLFPRFSPEFSIPRVYSSLRVVVFFLKRTASSQAALDDETDSQFVFSFIIESLSAFPLNLFKFESKTYRNQVLINSSSPPLPILVSPLLLLLLLLPRIVYRIVVH